MAPSSFWTAFRDFESNPVIEPPWPEWLVADPTVLPPGDTPDGRWHLVANSLGRLRHYTSDDGFRWERMGGALCAGIRPCLRREGETFYLFYERYVSFRRSLLVLRTSPDLRRWSRPQTVLAPEYAWEGRRPGATGNPCVVSGPFGYRLYYSASAVWLRDCLFIEPRYIGVAESDSITGPYRKRKAPILAPSSTEPYRNFGAGAIKVFPDGDGYVGLNNGIYKDALGRSRSAVLLLHSEDGISWRKVREEPILKPEGTGWKRALVYAVDVAFHEDEVRVYYNARSGWLIGAERIGVALARRGGAAPTSARQSSV